MKEKKNVLDLVSKDFAEYVAEFGRAKQSGSLTLTLHFRNGVPRVADFGTLHHYRYKPTGEREEPLPLPCSADCADQPIP